MSEWQDIGNVAARLMSRGQGSIGFDVQDQVPEDFLPVYDPRFIEGITDYSKPAEPLVHSKESVFNEFADDTLFEKRDQLEKMLFDGTLAVQGGLGIGFQAYSDRQAIVETVDMFDTKFEEFILKYDLSE